MAEQFTNRAETTLNGAIDDNDTSLVVTSATGFPTSGDFRIVIDSRTATEEILTVTAVSGTTFTVTRATEAIAGVQTAFSHSDGATVKHVLTAGALENFSMPTGTIGARVYQTAITSMTNSAYTTYLFDTESFDTDGFHSVSSNTGRFTIPAGLGGRYLVMGVASFAPTAAGTRGGKILIDGATTAESTILEATVNGTYAPRLPITAIVTLNAGQYVELQGYQDSGGAINSSAGNTTFSIVKLDSGRVGTGIGAVVYNNATQSINDSTETAVTFNSEDFDTDGFHSTSSNTSRLTIPTGLGGKYFFRGGTRYTGDADGIRDLKLRKNGTTNLRQVQDPSPSGAAPTDMEITGIFSLEAGDYIELIAYHTAGAATNIGHGSAREVQSTLEIMRLDSLPPTSQGQWQSYTPSWTGSGSNPSIGNGIILGRWKYIDNKTALIRIYIELGSTTTVGSGNYSFSLPVTTANDTTGQVLTGIFFDTSASQNYPLAGRVTANSSSIVRSGTGGNLFSATSPVTPAVGDTITFHGFVEVA